jgi:glycine hydroxymethyltransferase
MDKELFDLIEKEKKRQNEGIELIASENYASADVLKAAGSVLTNKYSEGYPGNRYYGGQENIDAIENLTIKRAKKMFGLSDNWHVNVQSYSGSPANNAIYLALLEFGDTLMGMSLSSGGHLTHGAAVSFSGKAYRAVQYGVGSDGYLDYDNISELALEYKPKLIICGYTAYPRTIDFKRFKKIAESVGAYLMADISHISGLIIGGCHPSPFSAQGGQASADIVMTTTHKTLRGPRGAIIICKKELAEKIDKAVFPGFQGGPHDHITAAKAIAFGEAIMPEFKKYASKIIENAQSLSFELTRLDFKLVTGGTDNHLILVDLSNKGITGKQAQDTLDKVGITLNKNSIPYDFRPPSDPSGVRIGTPAVTTRGFGEPEMKKIALWIDKAIKNKNNDKELARIKKEVKELCQRFPVPGIN